jgi:hypothetical protein
MTSVGSSITSVGSGGASVGVACGAHADNTIIAIMAKENKAKIFLFICYYSLLFNVLPNLSIWRK